MLVADWSILLFASLGWGAANDFYAWINIQRSGGGKLSRQDGRRLTAEERALLPATTYLTDHTVDRTMRIKFGYGNWDKTAQAILCEKLACTNPAYDYCKAQAGHYDMPDSNDCLLLLPGATDALNAETQCGTNGGFLVQPITVGQVSFLYTSIIQPNDNAWTGLYTLAAVPDPQDWRRDVDGVPTAVNNSALWAPGEPMGAPTTNPAQPSHAALHVNTSAGLHDEVWNAGGFRPLCQYQRACGVAATSCGCGWHMIGDSCFKFDIGAVTFAAATCSEGFLADSYSLIVNNHNFIASFYNFCIPP